MTLRRKLAVIFILYLAEGIPYGFVLNTLSVYFRLHGMDLRAIGLVGLIGLPWSLKFLWAPLVDRWGRRFWWIVPAQCVVAACILGLTALDPAQPHWLLWLLVLGLCVAGATQDIAIDAYTIDLLRQEELGVANGTRVAAYRVALLSASGGVVALSEWTGWAIAFAALAVLLLAIAATIAMHRGFHAPRVGAIVHTGWRDWWRSWWLPLQDILSRRAIWAVLLFLLTFKIGDAVMGLMVSTFWVDRGLTRHEIGFLQTTSGMGMTVLGSVIGGLCTTRWGIGRALWVLGALQALSNLGYAAAALPHMPAAAIYPASYFESFTAGLGTAAFMAFTMALCKKQFSASEFALYSALTSLTTQFARYGGSLIAHEWGYFALFVSSFFCALPAFALLPWILPLLRTRAHD
ncbi:MAG: MFS transporter [Deltaproteobacteria bacterium]|nr:MFS transporter [Deltaproteobacteria bacterium]